MWTTFYPREPFRVRWNFRQSKVTGSEPLDGDMNSTEVGKSYTLMLRPNLKAGHLIGTKEALLARREMGDDFRSSGWMLDKPLRLVAENEVQFTVIP